MIQKPDDDEASFEGLLCLDTVPPPGNAGDAPASVHDARTTVAELPEAFLESLKNGMKAEVAVHASAAANAHPPPQAPAFEQPPPAVEPSYVPRPVAPEPDMFAKQPAFLELSTRPTDLETALASALDTRPPQAGPSPPLYQQPFPTGSEPRASAPRTAARIMSPQQPGWGEGVLFVLVAVLVACGIAAAAWALVFRHLA